MPALRAFITILKINISLDLSLRITKSKGLQPLLQAKIKIKDKLMLAQNKA